MAKGGFPGMGGNMNSLMKQAQKFQQQMEEMQKDLGDKRFEASVGGGAVTAIANGKRQLVDVKIKPEVVDPDDVEMLQDLIMSACNEALKKAEDETSNEMGKLTGGLNMPGMF
ncbi:YbaB/EbfC family nucleoid-associated protein [Clostridium tagluense]|uniref:YbaB/EbfC family nucleoid-associated protein n=1 Tax=Clostridium TaxID=1485 RepID=UPI0013E96053|nr:MULTISPECIES: YbaB/EbfC family nucleoid-associated protein [Clostridium]MBU3130323.1 YbaB/EbfC family nucleoid-associated protein [Clostridium tagluense]MBW9158606.1 YbaB/EbfC family nucleoid-associated protein [Clostridium tagluense]MBZ9621340.1 YbaB/EbfC family nucleoid-associated protein [Clostridium sp. FP2]MBZ9632758.1 YbaB/EbfC family nucleoid-associated protein [Clostridium sp. FP1]MCB2300543.1 YbaB/EbfC family nucleoid-associated protein [Clostridium tagluense]